MHRIIAANFDHIAEPKLDQVVFNVNTFPGPDGPFWSSISKNLSSKTAPSGASPWEQYTPLWETLSDIEHNI